MTTGFVSSLEDPRRRFLAAVTEHGLAHGMRSEADFIRHFPPRVIMAAIGDDSALRASLLEKTLGMKHKVGLRKSPTSAGDDLQIALEEGVTSAEAIVALFTADDRARCLDGAELWAYAIEPDFWRTERDSADAWAMARDHIAFILERGLREQLLAPRDIADGLTLALLVHHLPEDELEAVLAATLRQARIHEPFSEVELLDVVPPAMLAEHVPLAEIWDRVIIPYIAENHGLAGGAPRRAQAPSKEAASPSAEAPSAVSAVDTSRTTQLGMPALKAPTSKLVAMPKPVPRIGPPPPQKSASTEPEPSATKRASRAPRRSVPPRS